MKAPTLNDKLGAAIFILAFGAKDAGIMTTHKLMYPYTVYQVDDVKRVAARLVASVHTALIASVPQSRIELILKDQENYLSLALGDGWPDEKNPFQEVEQRRPVQ